MHSTSHQFINYPVKQSCGSSDVHRESQLMFTGNIRKRDKLNIDDFDDNDIVDTRCTGVLFLSLDFQVQQSLLRIV